MSVTLSQLRQVIREELLLDATERVEAETEAEAEIVATVETEIERDPSILDQLVSRDTLTSLAKTGSVTLRSSAGTTFTATASGASTAIRTLVSTGDKNAAVAALSNVRLTAVRPIPGIRGRLTLSAAGLGTDNPKFSARLGGRW